MCSGGGSQDPPPPRGARMFLVRSRVKPTFLRDIGTGEMRPVGVDAPVEFVAIPACIDVVWSSDFEIVEVEAEEAQQQTAEQPQRKRGRPRKG